MLRLNGITPVMATPFHEEGSIDEASLRKEIDFSIEHGAAAICGPGFGAEFYKLSDPERYRFAEVLVGQARGRVPVIISTGSGSVYNTVEFSKFAERLGADCLMVVPPQRVALPGSEVINFFSQLCDAVEIPVMLQDADFTGAGLPPNVFVDLASKHSNFLFAKLEVTLPGQKCAEIIRRSNGRLQVIYGLGGIAMLDGLAHGASAMMPGTAAIDIYVRIYEFFREGKRKEAKALFYQLLPYLAFALQHLELAIGIEKRLLAKRGVIASARMRRPTIFLDEEYEKQIEELVDDVHALSVACQRID
jgi:dihydrodipicolinate synthase/N-acetylneuraminate lyase